MKMKQMFLPVMIFGSMIATTVYNQAAITVDNQTKWGSIIVRYYDSNTGRYQTNTVKRETKKGYKGTVIQMPAGQKFQVQIGACSSEWHYADSGKHFTIKTADLKCPSIAQLKASIGL